jgi:hypothetical protein
MGKKNKFIIKMGSALIASLKNCIGNLVLFFNGLIINLWGKIIFVVLKSLIKLQIVEELQNQWVSEIPITMMNNSIKYWININIQIKS